VTYQRILPVVSLLALLILSPPRTVLSQAIQRSMVVSVVDKSGAPVSDLGPADFVVREDNVSREVLRVAPADDPMQLAILVDNSRAATDQIQDIRRALPGFLDVIMRPTASGQPNEIAILGLAERPTLFADYTFDRGRLDKAIGLVWERQAGSYLLDATIEVTRGFKKREAARPVIVAIATDGPELSSRHFTQVLDPLRDTGTTFHVITLGPPSPDISSDDAHNRDMVVEEGPRMSGGVHERLAAGSALPGRLKQLGEVLTHQYLVTYGHPDSLIPPDHITVGARRTDLTARGTIVKDPQARR
jgi:hypothetical protein